MRTLFLTAIAFLAGLLGGYRIAEMPSPSNEPGMHEREQRPLGVERSPDKLTETKPEPPEQAHLAYATLPDNELLRTLVSVKPSLYEETLQEYAADLNFRIIERLALEDPRAAARILEAMPLGQSQSYIHQLAKAWSKSDPYAALQWFEEQKPKLAMDDAPLATFGEILASLVAVDAPHALLLAESLPKPEERESSLLTVIREWGRHDPKLALKWLETADDELFSPNVFTELYAEAMESYAHLDPRATAKIVETIEANALQSRLAVEVVAAMAKSDLDAAEAWARSLKSPDTRSAALEQLVELFAEQSPQRALDLLLDLPDSFTPGPDVTAESVLSKLLETDQAWVLGQFDQFPPEGQSLLAKAFVQGELSESGELTPLANWLRSLPKGPAYDEGASIVTSHLIRTQPSEAIAWAASIGLPEKRSESLANVVEQSRISDLAQVVNALARIPIDEEERARLERLIISRTSEELSTLPLP